MKRYATAAWLAAAFWLAGCAASPEEPSAFRYDGSSEAVPWTGKAFDDGCGEVLEHQGRAGKGGFDADRAVVRLSVADR